ncbi:sodium-coupled neutral amino acid transporter 3-like [Diretmus argenteus]
MAEPPERDEFLPHLTDFEGKTSLVMSIFNLSNAIMGSGILGLAFAMSNTGIIPYILLCIGLAILSAYSIHLLLRSAEVVGIREYEQLGNRAFGLPGLVFTASVITVHNIGGMWSYLYIVKSELPLVIQAFLGQTYNTGEWFLDGDYLIMIVSAVIILPLALFKQCGHLRNTSGFSLTCMVFFLISVIYKKFNIDCPLDSKSGNVTEISEHFITTNETVVDDNCVAKMVTFNSQTVYSIPILEFAFVCHSEVLPIYTELRDATKKRMQTVANISILVVLVMYLPTAIFGYLTFYAAVECELLHTYSQVDPLDTLILCVRLAVLAVTVTVPVALFPSRPILQIVFPNKRFQWFTSFCVTIGLLFIANLLVIYVPSIRVIFGLIGATTTPLLIYILPGVFYIRIVPEEQEPLKSGPKIQAACFAFFGFILMVLCSSFVINDWGTGESRSGGGH